MSDLRHQQRVPGRGVAHLDPRRAQRQVRRRRDPAADELLPDPERRGPVHLESASHRGCAAQQPGQLPGGRSDHHHPSVPLSVPVLPRPGSRTCYVAGRLACHAQADAESSACAGITSASSPARRTALQLPDQHQHVLHRQLCLRAAQLEAVPAAPRLCLQRGQGLCVPRRIRHELFRAGLRRGRAEPAQPAVRHGELHLLAGVANRIVGVSGGRRHPLAGAAADRSAEYPAASGTRCRRTELLPLPRTRITIRRPKSWSRTAPMQKQIGANVFTVAYVGELGRHLQYAPNANLPAPSGTAVTPAYLSLRDAAQHHWHHASTAPAEPANTTPRNSFSSGAIRKA